MDKVMERMREIRLAAYRIGDLTRYMECCQEDESIVPLDAAERVRNVSSLIGLELGRIKYQKDQIDEALGAKMTRGYGKDADGPG